MTRRIVRQDLLLETHGLLVHGCNAQGKAGAGIAYQLYRRYPEAFAPYFASWQAGTLRAGQLYHHRVNEHLVIAHAITQTYYGRDPARVYVELPAITQAFTQVSALALATGLPVKLPLIGCGLAGGQWSDIGPLIVAALDPSLDVTLFV